jgi:DNA-binding response OmpR family regulator
MQVTLSQVVCRPEVGARQFLISERQVPIYNIAMARILLVEDDQLLSDQVASWLRREQHYVEAVNSAEAAENFLRSTEFDLLVLDWGLPGKSGLSLCRELRERGNRMPVLFLTGKAEIQDKEAGFNSGADDYLTKPFAMPELGFRIKALLRRAPAYQDTNVLKVRGLVLEPGKYRLHLFGEEIRLLPREFAVLEFLMRHPGEVFSPETLFNRIWASDSTASAEAVSVCVRRLRKKIDRDPEHPLISNIHGVGYRLEP